MNMDWCNRNILLTVFLMLWNGLVYACMHLAYQLVTEQGPGRYKKLQRWMSSVWVFMNYCIKYYVIFYRAFITDLRVSSYTWNLSRVFIIFPFPVICKISIISSVDPIESLLSKRCCANLDFPFSYLKSWKWSWNIIWTDCQSVQYTFCYNYDILTDRCHIC